MTSPALCEVCTDAGRESALQAVGICEECGRAFCRSHRARTQYEYNIPGYDDWCSGCMAAWKSAKEAKAKAEADQDRTELARIAELVKLVEAAGVEPVGRFRTVSRLQKTLFGKKQVREKEAIAPAWPVGDLKWRTSEGRMHGEIESAMPSGITRKLKIVPLDGPADGRWLAYGWDKEILDGDRVLERSSEVRRQVIDTLERLAGR